MFNEEMTKKEETDNSLRIFLNRSDVPGLKKPLLPGYRRIGFPWKNDEYLKILKVIGVDNVDVDVRDFHINGSAVKYLVDVALFKDGYRGPEVKVPTNPIQRRVLFVGGVQIYQERDIEDQKFNGLQLIRDGRVQTITSATERNMGDCGLLYLMFGKASTKKGHEKRVKAILGAYDDQEIAINHARTDARMAEFRNGESSGRWKARHGYGF